MNTIKIMVMGILMLVLIPFVFADINVDCNPRTVSVGGSTVCSVSLSSPAQSISGIEFNIQQTNGNFFVLQNAAGPANFLVTTNPSTGYVSLATTSVGQSPTILATLTLVSTAVGATSIQIASVSGRPIILDDQFNPVNYGVINPSATLTVQALGQPVCGDGIIQGTDTVTEFCDDANVLNGDGCSSTCTVESGFSCNGVPSVCTSGPSCTLGGFSPIDLNCLLGNVRIILEDNVEYPSRLQKIAAIANELGKYFG